MQDRHKIRKQRHTIILAAPPPPSARAQKCWNAMSCSNLQELQILLKLITNQEGVYCSPYLMKSAVLVNSIHNL